MNDSTKHMDRSDNFIRLLLDWKQALPGRGLPWTRNSNPYMIWISEIMLQQTRAQTVVPYFERFINEFPDIDTLADAPEDQVLGLWAGLGYYARARNLHAAAQYIRDHCDGQFPYSFDEILNLPGVGRSTAGAICALAYGMRTPILDGNAKRVYSRFFCIDDDSESERNRKLWEISDIHTPEHQSEKYTQLIMDLGAIVCLPKNPLCNRCPVASSCQAFRNDLTHRLPIKKKSSIRHTKSTTMIMAMDRLGRVLLERRAAKGIWGGLWSFPEYRGEPEYLIDWMRKRYFVQIQCDESWTPFHHDFTHFRLRITPQPACVLKLEKGFTDQTDFKFFTLIEIIRKGVPAPVFDLLCRIREIQGKLRLGTRDR